MAQIREEGRCCSSAARVVGILGLSLGSLRDKKFGLGASWHCGRSSDTGAKEVGGGGDPLRFVSERGRILRGNRERGALSVIMLSIPSTKAVLGGECSSLALSSRKKGLPVDVRSPKPKAN